MSDNGSASNSVGLEVRGLQVRYRGGLALHSVDFTLAPGHRMGVVGRNGAGKSTLVAILTGLIRPDRGAIRLGSESAPALADPNSAHHYNS